MKKEFYLKQHLALLSANAIFGLNAPIVKSILNHPETAFTAYSLSMFRMAGAAAVFWIASLFFSSEKVSGKDLLKMLLAAVFGIVLNQFLFIIGLAHTSPVNALVLETLVPIVTMILAALYLKEPITGKKGFGVLLGAAGAVMLILAGRSASGAGSVRGDLIVLASGLSYALYFTMFKGIISRYSVLTLMKWMFLFSTVICSPFCIGDLLSVNYPAIDLQIACQIAFVVLLGTFLAYMFIPVGQKKIRPTVVSMYMYVQPVVAATVAVLIGMDTFGAEKAVATALVFSGVWFVTQSKSRRQLSATDGQP